MRGRGREVCRGLRFYRPNDLLIGAGARLHIKFRYEYGFAARVYYYHGFWKLYGSGKSRKVKIAQCVN